MLKAFLASLLLMASCAAQLPQPTGIPVHFHDPYHLATHTQLVGQVDKLNSILHANGSTLVFRFASEDATKNHIGTAEDLNVGIVLSPAYLGLTEEFPWQLAKDGLSHDFILLDIEAITDPDYSGYVLAHETGHWLGLFHTASPGNCMKPGPDPLIGCHFTPDQIDTMEYFAETLR